jgi:hypothetical protein
MAREIISKENFFNLTETIPKFLFTKVEQENYLPPNVAVSIFEPVIKHQLLKMANTN